MGRVVEICWLYPELMNLYGDRGNVIAISQRCAWRSLEPKVTHVSTGESVDFSRFDIIFMGGGQDREQMLLAKDFEDYKGQSLHEAVAAGVPTLTVCGAFQLLGKYYLTAGGERLPGLGIFDVWTEAGTKRLIGNVVIESELGGTKRTVVGFENHSGQTFLGPGAQPLGRVLKGHGNNGKDGREGVCHHNALGTYLHGSILPKNPWLTDWLISQALARRYGDGTLPPLDDRLEQAAHDAVKARLLRG